MKFVSYEAALTYLYSFYKTVPSRVPANFAVRAALSMLGIINTPRSNKIIHITGTNGKGSVAIYSELFLLSMRRYDTVILTSPHINSVRERIRLNGAPIGKELFIELLEMASHVLERLRETEFHPSSMTIVTILALLLQENLGNQCVGVYEVGVGGKHDSTNVFEHAIIGLTPVTNDHVDRFGGSTESMLLEKLGLCRQSSTLIHQIQDPLLLDVLNWYCSKNNIDHAPVAAHTIHQVQKHLYNMLLPGAWQLDNASLAFEIFKKIEPTSPDVEAVSERIKVRPPYHPGRLQSRTIGKRTIVLDGAHNVSAIHCVLSFFEYKLACNNSCIAILGFSESKHWREMIQLIITSNWFSAYIFTQSTRPRGVNPHELAAFASPITKAPVMAMASLPAALGWALKNTSEMIFISGSLLLVGDFDKALHALGLSDWAVPFAEIDPPQPWMHTL